MSRGKLNRQNILPWKNTEFSPWSSVATNTRKGKGEKKERERETLLASCWSVQYLQWNILA